MGLWRNLFGGREDAQPPQAWPEIPEIDSESDPEFIDLKLVLRYEPRSGLFVARGNYRKSRVGFAFRFGPEWREWEPPEVDLRFYVGAVTLQSVGGESDEWLAALSKLYAVATPAERMVNALECEAIALEGDPRRVSGAVRLKLFVNPRAEDPRDYGEAFLSLEADWGHMRFGEKDPEYRSAWIRALGDVGSQEREPLRNR